MVTRSRSAALACALAACGGSGGAPVTSGVVDLDGSAANAYKAGSAADASGSNGESDGAAHADAEDTVAYGGFGEAGVDAASTPSATQTFVRFADWAPDAPSAGFDFCLAPTGTTQWMGPLLQQDLPAGSLGPGGPNGLEFPTVTTYFAIAPGDYDLQVVATGSTDCTAGTIPVTMGLPFLAAGAYTTFALMGDVQPTGDDASLAVGAFPDDSTAPGGGALVRAINAIPSLAYIDVGSGSVGANNLVPVFADVPFGTASSTLVDGGAADPNGYTAFSPTPDVQFSAQASGTGTDSATATHVVVGAGTVMTLALINGQNGGKPPQFLVCSDNGQALGSMSPCKVFPQ
ncbi:MAG: DUF4397 domain-containing protein [Polyangiaceae bacterium]